RSGSGSGSRLVRSMPDRSSPELGTGSDGSWPASRTYGSGSGVTAGYGSAGSNDSGSDASTAYGAAGSNVSASTTSAPSPLPTNPSAASNPSATSAASTSASRSTVRPSSTDWTGSGSTLGSDVPPAVALAMPDLNADRSSDILVQSLC